MIDKIPLTKLNILPKLVQDYLGEKETVKPYYDKIPTIENLLNQIPGKSKCYKNRNLLYQGLLKQHQPLHLSKKQKANLISLQNENTFTICTGHQLNLFTGPLYSFYKILQTIKLCEELKSQSDKYQFVPIFWMATEDHDFEEINHFWFGDKKVVWNQSEKGAVGRFSTKGLAAICETFFIQLPKSEAKDKLYKLFKNSYLEGKTLADAHRILIHELFKEYGLLILDADSADLKASMEPYFKEELLQNSSYQEVLKTNVELGKENYKIQVNPREINLFYLKGGLRERIVKVEEDFKILNTNISFSEEEILKELNNHPERFSPNVLLRPLYQEVILPNLAYIGGAGEISYWLQLKSYFDSQNVPFPFLIVRNSVLIKSEKQRLKQEKLNISNQELFLPLHKLVDKKVMEKSTLNIDFARYEENLETMFNELKEKAKQTDQTFEGMVNAQYTKQTKGLRKMKQRMIKAEVKVHKNLKERIEFLHNTFFRNENLQERNQNFSVFWLDYDSSFIQSIYQDINALESDFNFVTLQDS